MTGRGAGRLFPAAGDGNRGAEPRGGLGGFIDREPRCCAIIKMNLEKTKFSEQSHVYCMPAARALSFLDKEYSVIIMDPPYPDTSIHEVVEQLAGSKLINQDSVVVVTHSSRFLCMRIMDC